MTQQQTPTFSIGDTVTISPSWKRDICKKASISKGFTKVVDAHARYQTQFIIHNISIGSLYGLVIYNLRELDKEKPMDKAFYEGMLALIENRGDIG